LPPEAKRIAAMKKILLILVFVVALISALIWYVLSRYGVTDSAEIVPADAVAFVAFPDLVQSGIRWNQTALAKIGAEPTIRAFLERPLGLVGQGGMDEAIGILSRLKPGRIFAALYSLNESGGAALLGFQYFGSKKDYEEAIERFHREVMKVAPGAVRTEIENAGSTIIQIQSGEHSLFTGSHTSWGFVSNDLATLKDALDRVSGRSVTPSLADAENFRTVRGELSRTAEMVWFLETTPFLDLLLTEGQAQGAAVNPAQLEQLRQISAVGGSLAFSGADQVERIFMLWKDIPELPAIDRSGLEFTSADNIFFFEGTQDWRTLSSAANIASLPPEIFGFLTENGVDLKKLPEIFGTESVAVANWPPDAMFPTALLAVSIKDRPAIEAMTRGVVEKFAPSVTISERHGATVFDFPIPGIPLIDPAVAVSDGHLVVALTSGALTGAMNRAPGQETLANSTAFQSVSAQWEKKSQSFMFIDTQTIFERIYNTARPMIIFGAAMSPDVAKAVDIQNLPETETISKHLGPIVMTQHATPNGWLIESSGPITLYQTILAGALGVGVSAAANTWIQQR